MCSKNMSYSIKITHTFNFLTMFFDKFIYIQTRLIEMIDPSDINIKLMSKLYFMPISIMKFLFEMAVKQGLFDKHMIDTRPVYSLKNRNKKIIF